RRSCKGHDRLRLFRSRARCKVTAAAPAPAVRRRLLPGQRRVNARPAPPRIDTRLRRSGFSPNAHPPTTSPNDKVLRARDPKGCASRSRLQKSYTGEILNASRDDNKKDHSKIQQPTFCYTSAETHEHDIWSYN
ncbi:Uncharacterized protein FWK35_00034109, partial [Aphis craccivora]